MTENTVRSRVRKWLGVFLGVTVAGMFVHLVLPTTVWAQGHGAPRPTIGSTNPGTLRTTQDMIAFDAAHPDIPVAMSSFRPTMDFAQYRASKAAAAAAVGTTSNLVPIPEAAPIPGNLTCVGIDQAEAGGGFPPDTHGAVGLAHIGQVVNSKIRFYTKALSAGPPGPPLGCPNAIVLEAT